MKKEKNNKVKFSKETISKIENALKLHINYEGKSSNGKYLKLMDELTVNYPGPRGLALSNMLDDYYKQVGVSNLEEAFNKLKNK
jgi:diacylglycerol kinase family enzyme